MLLKILILVLLLFQTSALPSQEKYLSNIRQLTFGGENAEAYFSSDGQQLIFQSTREGYPCDQIYTMKTDGSQVRRVSAGKGRTTCGYFYPGSNQILYSSTHENSPDCPLPPDRSRGYVWGLYPYDIFSGKADGTDLRVLSSSPAYDAEATISPDGKSIIFTSDRDGDLELYLMDRDGKNVRRLTNSPGYDGGAFFSPDSKKIVWRAHHIQDPEKLKEHQELLKSRLVKPSELEIYVMNSDGTGIHQVTKNGAANFCPYFHPDGKRIVFASNMNDPGKRNFDIYIIDTDGQNLHQITFNPTFDGFPMFSPDGKQLVFASNRNAKAQGETNIFIADWTEPVAHGIQKEQIQKDVEYLSSDAMKGRLTGSPEARKAAEYIADEFRIAGLQNLLQLSTPFQPFEFTSGIKLGPSNSLVFHSKSGPKEYVLKKDFLPVGFSDDANLKNTSVVFAGYGIRATDLKHDDYANLDVKGKIVVCYRFGPEGDDPKSAFSQYYPIRYKAMMAREMGAAALLITSENQKEDELLPIRRDSTFGTAGIPVLSVKRDVVLQWAKAAGGTLPTSNNPHGPGVYELSGVSISLSTILIREKSKSDNVLGWLPSGVDTKETLVIGAHYDHLGMGMEGSLSSKWDVIHNGADDNASGVAGLLQMARFFGSTQSQLKRNILFIAFGGEELGVLGSSYFVKHPVIPLENVVAMINMDMIGRLRDEKLVVGGTGTSAEWKDLLNQVNNNGLKLTLNEDGFGPSDHSSFYGKNIPVLFFFTGAHAQYHKPEDDANLIEYEGMVKVLNYVSQVSQRILEMPSRPQYVRVKSKTQGIGTGGFRVYLGTIPDYAEEVKGVKLSGVREGSPAEKGGIKAGDVIVQFGDKEIENVYDYTYALQQHKPGDVVSVVVIRDGNRMPLEVTLERRSPTE